MTFRPSEASTVLLVTSLLVLCSVTTAYSAPALRGLREKQRSRPSTPTATSALPRDGGDSMSSVTASASAAAAGSAPEIELTDAEPAFVLGVIGDWGSSGNAQQRRAAAAFADVCSRVRCNRIISVGDNLYPAGAANVTDPQFNTCFEDVYTAPSLQVPWNLVLGNHDYGNADAQVAYSDKSLHGRWRMPAHHYALFVPLLTLSDRLAAKSSPSSSGTLPPEYLHLVFLDTTPFIAGYYSKQYMNHSALMEPNIDAQLAFLTRALKGELSLEDQDTRVFYARDGSSDVPLSAIPTAELMSVQSAQQARRVWTVVVGHHPVFTAQPDENVADEMKRMVLPLLREHRVHAYVSGHSHCLELMQHPKDDILYAVSGSGSDPQLLQLPQYPYTRFFDGSHLGFLTLQVSLRSAVLQLQYYGVPVRDGVRAESSAIAEEHIPPVVLHSTSLRFY